VAESASTNTENAEDSMDIGCTSAFSPEGSGDYNNPLGRIHCSEELAIKKAGCWTFLFEVAMSTYVIALA
jgi:hypothetical protein